MTGVSTYSGRDALSGEGKTLHVEDGIIRHVERCNRADLPVFSPGLVDLQVNGFQGHDLNEGELAPNVVEALSEALCRVGVAIYLPTIITASEHDLCQRLAAIREAQQRFPRSQKMIAGIHVEGPAVSNKDGPRGAHPVKHVRPPSIDEFDRWQEAAGGLVRMVTLAPETEGAIDFIRSVSSQDVCVALGHSDANDEDIEAAVAAGARMSTHLGNGIASTLPRHPNAIWAQLSEDRLTTSLILDGFHLPSSTARAMIRAKGTDRVVLVSDSVKFAGMPPGRYSSPIGGDVEVSENGKVSIADTPYLAGSGKSLLDIVRKFVGFTGLRFADAVRMATVNPSRILGLAPALEEGGAANFILFTSTEEEEAKVQEIVFDGLSVLQ